jgi:hypothetical protein
MSSPALALASASPSASRRGAALAFRAGGVVPRAGAPAPGFAGARLAGSRVALRPARRGARAAVRAAAPQPGEPGAAPPPLPPHPQELSPYALPPPPAGAGACAPRCGGAGRADRSPGRAHAPLHRHAPNAP